MNTVNIFNKKINTYWLLIIGILLTFATHMSFSIDLLAWFVNVPFLIYLKKSKNWKSKLLFILALIIAWSLVILKILSPPMPFFMIFLFSIPISLFHLPAYLIWNKYRKFKYSLFLFPAILTIMEWIQYTFTPFASWGVMAYTQNNNLSIVQLVSILGMPGLSFLIHWINISIFQLVTHEKKTIYNFHLPIIMVFLLVVFGSLRIQLGEFKDIKTISVATINTTSKVSGLPLPSKETNQKVMTDLISNTEKAAHFGAQLIVWNEASFFTTKKEESQIVNTLKSIAQKNEINLIASYVMPISEDPFQYENKYVYILPNGKISHTYFKHEPVAGEPAIKGTKPFQTTTISDIKIGAVICYDYSFPYIAQAMGNLQADIVAVPSSDWKGIDPLHSRMAAFRAVEQGHAIIRSTRFGLSAAITPYGKMIAQQSSFDDNNKIMIANLPSKKITTIYSVIGDLFIILCFVFLTTFSIKYIYKK